jgi:hypothetical protein
MLFGVYVFVLAQLAAGIGYRQCDTARIACAGIDDHQCIAEAAAMGAFCSDMSDVSVQGAGMLLTAAARRASARRAG